MGPIPPIMLPPMGPVGMPMPEPPMLGPIIGMLPVAPAPVPPAAPDEAVC